MGRGIPNTTMAESVCVCKKVGSFLCSLLPFLLVAFFMFHVSSCGEQGLLLVTVKGHVGFRSCNMEGSVVVAHGL